MKTFVIIPSGGKGSRAGFKIPKQYLKIAGKELICYTLQSFQKNKLIDEIVIPADPEYFKLLERIRKKYNFSKISKVVKGGKERQDSVYAALLALKADSEDLVAVHDAVRPMLPPNVLTNALITARNKGNAVVCIKARDTLLAESDSVFSYPKRNGMYYIQTPQIFKYSILLDAMRRAYEKKFIGTDESIIVASAGEKIHLVEGSVFNFKVTTGEDLQFLKKLIK